jgi:hypothetical protein
MVAGWCLAAPRPVEDRPDQRQATLLAGQPADDLDPAAGLPERVLDQVGVPDALAVLGLEQQVGDERVEVVGHAGDRGGVQRLPLGDEPLGTPAGLGDGGLALGLDLVEDRPGDADQAGLMQAGRKRALDRRAQPLAAAGDDQQRRPPRDGVRWRASTRISRAHRVAPAGPAARKQHSRLPCPDVTHPNHTPFCKHPMQLDAVPSPIRHDHLQDSPRGFPEPAGPPGTMDKAATCWGWATWMSERAPATVNRLEVGDSLWNRRATACSGGGRAHRR